ncbi:MAG TPA: ATP-binding protein [Anaeromyxobacter sp.]|nr:ATP-binding protein [Anaeromyxobacter sp.]
MRLANGSIRRRVLVGFAFVLVLLAAELGVALRGLARVRELRREIAQAIEPPLSAAEELERIVLYRAVMVRSYVATGDARHLQEHARRLDRQRELLAGLERFPLEPESAAALEALAGAAGEHASDTAAFLSLVAQGAAPEAIARQEIRVSQAREGVLARTRAFEAIQRRLVAAARSRSVEVQEEVARALVATAILVAIALAVTALLTMRAVRGPALALVGAARALEAGEFGPALALARDRRGRGELHALAIAFCRMARALRRRERRMAADGRVGEALAAPLDARATASAALREIAAYAGAELGAVYVAEDGSLRLLAAHGAGGAPGALERVGLVGEAVASGRALALQPIPSDLPVTLPFGFGEARPRAALAVPLSARGAPVGVVLLASTSAFGEDAISFAERAAGQLAIAIANALAHGRLETLALELRDSNQRLRGQNDELQAQREEIQAQAEELHAQTEELHAQADEIRRHNAELASAREALTAKAEALEEIDRRKDEFLATLAHELRNPLAAVASAGRLLEGHDGPGARHAAVIGRQVGHLRRLVDDLLDLSRITLDRIQLRRERLELPAVVERAADGVRAAAEAKGQKLAIRAAGEVPEVDGDPIRLEQVLSNLLRNAIRYTPPKGTISVAVEADRGDAVVRVGDTGMGIPADLLPRIFEPFVQGTHSEGGEEGLGLGLALVRRLVELHGGSVEARSEGPGTGTVFCVRLPLAAVAAPAAVSAPPVPARAHHDGRLRVLLVEDHPDVALTTAEALDLFGYAVHVEADADAGLRACLECPPDVALLDIGLPGRSGLDLARDIRARLPRDMVRLIAVTGYGQPEDRIRSEEAGFDAHLVKPVELDELREVIERLALQGATPGTAARDASSAAA